MLFVAQYGVGYFSFVFDEKSYYKNLLLSEARSSFLWRLVTAKLQIVVFVLPMEMSNHAMYSVVATHFDATITDHKTHPISLWVHV